MDKREGGTMEVLLGRLEGSRSEDIKLVRGAECVQVVGVCVVEQNRIG